MNLKQSIKSLILLALPIILGQIGQMLITAGDVYIASMYSTSSVASIGVAGGIINPFFLFGIGLTIGISPSISIGRGAGTDRRDSLTSIVVYSSFWGMFVTLLALIASHFIPHFGLEPSLIPSIQKYISIVAWSLPFGIIFQGIKEYLQAYEDVVFANAISIFAVFLNLAANYILVFGFFGISPIGEEGLAWASLITRVVQFLFIFLYVVKKEKWFKFSMQFSLNTFKFSLPIAIMFFMEVLAFCSVTILSGKISVIAAATNNIIMTLASILFMIPLSISSAVAVKIGNAFGRKDFAEIKLYTTSSLIIIIGFVLLSSFFLLAYPQTILQFISNDPAVILLGVKLLLIVAIFQFSDSVQVVLTGILRGLEQTKLSSIMVFIGYWIFGIPTGYYLAFYADYGAVGLWLGLAISLGLVAIFLGIFTFIKIYKKPKIGVSI